MANLKKETIYFTKEIDAMLKKSLTLFLIALCFSINVNTFPAQAGISTFDSSIQKQYEEVGYTTTKKALTEFKNKNEKFNDNNIKNIDNAVPIDFTHKFGRITKRAELELEYVNVRTKSLFNIKVSSVQSSLKQRSSNERLMSTKEEIKFYAFENEKMHLIRFQHNGWEYEILANKKGSDNDANLNTLKQVINSITSQA